MIDRLWAVAATALLAAGCASLESQTDVSPFAGQPPRIDLDATPFFAQEKYQCGPAALASVLVAAGVHVTADELVPRVYVPARRGSLQIEMLAATRSAGRIAFVIEPSSAALAREVAAGKPVLVLLNLGISAWPRWHYAVVVGFDSRRQLWWLRSGRTRRQAMSAQRFEGAWRRAERWAVVVLEPGRLPASDDVARYIAAVAAFERLGTPTAAALAYDAAIARKPASASLHFALGNARLAESRPNDAEAAFRVALALEPDHVPARNNLADLLNRRGCRAAALNEITRALQLAKNGPYEAAVRDTYSQIQASPPDRACQD